MLLATLLATNKYVGGQMLIKESIFSKVDSFDVFEGYKLMENKENSNKIPCYFCFYDLEDKEIILFVTISSKVNKYKTI